MVLIELGQLEIQVSFIAFFPTNFKNTFLLSLLFLYYCYKAIETDIKSNAVRVGSGRKQLSGRGY